MRAILHCPCAQRALHEGVRDHVIQRDLVIRRRHRRSQANTLIFRGRGCFHTIRHRSKRRGSSKSSLSQRSRYSARAMKRGPFHTHASCAVSDGRRSARSSCRLSISATRWSGNAAGKAGTQALCQVHCTEPPGSVDNALRQGTRRTVSHVPTSPLTKGGRTSASAGNSIARST